MLMAMRCLVRRPVKAKPVKNLIHRARGVLPYLPQRDTSLAAGWQAIGASEAVMIRY